MSLNVFERFTKLALVRAGFWLAMGNSLFLMPEFLLGGVFYVLIGYLLVNAVLRIIIFYREATAGQKQDNKEKSISHYSSLAIAIFFMIVAVHLAIFRELLNEFTPVFLGGLLMLEGILYFVIALCAPTTFQKSFLIVFSGIVFLSASAVIAFTFGFGIGGVYELTMVLGVALLLAFLFEIAAFCVYRKSHTNRFDKEDVR